MWVRKCSAALGGVYNRVSGWKAWFYPRTGDAGVLGVLGGTHMGLSGCIEGDAIIYCGHEFMNLVCYR